MELSQPRPCGAQGAKPTHDFLSLYSPAQKDPTPTIPGAYLKTQDFLQPLDRIENDITYIEKPFPPAPRATIEHILPGGIGTYSINHVSYINQSQKVPKPEGCVITGAQSSSSDKNDENSNCSSYTGSGFTMWEECNIKKGKTGKVDTLKPDQNPNTTRSKHSATEQRRRSKINDRFLTLRELMPHGDQKRDKASFLLEVVEYIQFLQEKVHKYEESCREWTNEPPNGVLGPALVFPAKPNEHNFLVSGTSSLDAIKLACQNPQLTNKPSLFAATAASQTQPQLQHSRSCTTNCSVASEKLKDQGLIIESGTISISTIYSQGLSSALTQALQSSGVDLSQANISVQIDLGKRSKTSTLDSSTPLIKKNETPIDQASTWEENVEYFKKLKRSRN